MVNALGPPLDKLKLLRAFRVFRLFKRIESLNKIIVALLRSVPGVANAFLVMFIFFCIYAILAVELFRDFGHQGFYNTYEGNLTFEIDASTTRGLNVGLEYYGTFMRSLYTLFQVMTGESWSEAVARPLLFGFSDNMGLSAIVVGIYFVSFIILMQLVLINVVVAVLLDNFTDTPGDDADTPDSPKEIESEVENVSSTADSSPNISPTSKGRASPAFLQEAPEKAIRNSSSLPPPSNEAFNDSVAAQMSALLSKMDSLASAVTDCKQEIAAMRLEAASGKQSV